MDAISRSVSAPPARPVRSKRIPRKVAKTKLVKNIVADPVVPAPVVAAPAAVRQSFALKLPRRSMDRVAQAVVVLAPFESGFRYGKTFKLVDGDTYVRIWSKAGIPASEVGRIYLKLKEHFTSCEMLDEQDPAVSGLFADIPSAS